MAITPLTGFKSFTFDGEVSTNYGVQILGEGVFNAPERSVEMIEIPGRNGAYALDKGRFENIEVTYPANIIATNTTDFADAVSDLRNMLCSRKGYCRLTDDYHPNEYRMAVYKSGLEVDEKALRAGEFDIVFECKPQRWLTSGESKVSLQSGESITNPTLFDASPMLEVEGYGTIDCNGYEIEIENRPLGEVTLRGNFNARTTGGNASTITYSVSFDSNSINPGDSIYINRLSANANNAAGSAFGRFLYDYYNTTFGTPSYTVSNTSRYDEMLLPYGEPLGTTVLYMYPDPVSFTYGTAGSFTASFVLSIPTTYNGSTATSQLSISETLTYDGGTTLTSSLTRTIVSDPLSAWSFSTAKDGLASFWGALKGYSTLTALGHPTYIDCDLGVVYMIENGTVIDLNSYVDLGSDLPVLSPGANTITYSGNITSVDVVPRWWKV